MLLTEDLDRLLCCCVLIYYLFLNPLNEGVVCNWVPGGEKLSRIFVIGVVGQFAICSNYAEGVR